MKTIGTGPEDVNAAKAVLGTIGGSVADCEAGFRKAVRLGEEKRAAAAELRELQREAEAKGDAEAASDAGELLARSERSIKEQNREAIRWAELLGQARPPMEAAALRWGFDLSAFGWSFNGGEDDEERIIELRELCAEIIGTAHAVLATSKNAEADRPSARLAPTRYAASEELRFALPVLIERFAHRDEAQRQLEQANEALAETDLDDPKTAWLPGVVNDCADELRMREDHWSQALAQYKELIVPALAEAHAMGIDCEPFGWTLDDLREDPKRVDAVVDVCRRVVGRGMAAAAGRVNAGDDAVGVDAEAEVEVVAEPKARPLPGCLDVSTAAARLKKSERTIRNWCSASRKPCHNAELFSERWAIPEADVEAHRR